MSNNQSHKPFDITSDQIHDHTDVEHQLADQFNSLINQVHGLELNLQFLKKALGNFLSKTGDETFIEVENPNVEGGANLIIRYFVNEENVIDMKAHFKPNE